MELYTAINKNDTDAVKKLIDEGVNVNWHNLDHWGKTALHLASGAQLAIFFF